MKNADKLNFYKEDRYIEICGMLVVSKIRKINNTFCLTYASNVIENDWIEHLGQCIFIIKLEDS